MLVIHPFAKSIKRQYEFHRDRIFGEYSDFILPEFASLQVIPAVQTIAGNTGGYETWFDALKQMENEIDKADFDVALIGCGAYGFPLASYCKRIGKQGIHIGGSLQLYFGIKGKRWDDKGLYNEFWINRMKVKDLQIYRKLKTAAIGKQWLFVEDWLHRYYENNGAA